jgi:leucyl aminopeptidase (aminopeptidase T)
MTDPRYTKLARLLVSYSTALKKGDRVLLDMIDVPDEFSVELIREARATGAIPVVEARHTRLNRELLRATTPEHARLVRDIELSRMRKMQAYTPMFPATSWLFTPGSPGPCSISVLTRPVGAFCVGQVPAWPRPPA